MAKVLLVYPEYPPSYWSGKYALEFLGRKSSMPPLGLLTIASMFPDSYELRVLDMNVEPLTDTDIEWADYVFLSAMIVQRASFAEAAARAKRAGKPVVAGGPFPTSFMDEIENVDHFLLGEVEDFFTNFLRDLERGEAAPVYEAPRDDKGLTLKPDVCNTRPPRFDLINVRNYGCMSLQFSRGCPFDCEFCDITKLFGRLSRAKSNEQMFEELEVLYKCGWRGPIFLVDDNFIGNRRNVERFLPELTRWQKEHSYPFSFFTEASVNLAEMPSLMSGMVGAGFDMVFLGLETPNPEALRRSNKIQNIKKGDPEYLMNAVQKIQQAGMEVTGGFILGLDGDGPESFDAQIEFIQKAGIPQAMVGLLTALRGTNLYERLRREGRLVKASTGNNVSTSLNFVPQLDSDVLIAGYKRVLSYLYDRSLSNYFRRCSLLVKNWNQQKHVRRKCGASEYRALVLSIVRQLPSRQGPAYLRFLIETLITRPMLLPEAIRLGILGYHLEKVTRQQVLVDEFESFLEVEKAKIERLIPAAALIGNSSLTEIKNQLSKCFNEVRQRYSRINKDFRGTAETSLMSFQETIRNQLSQVRDVLQFDIPWLAGGMPTP